jgi:DNA-binding XRE family transcriptional regulator
MTPFINHICAIRKYFCTQLIAYVLRFAQNSSGQMFEILQRPLPESTMIPPLKATRLERRQTLQKVASAVGTDAGNLSRIENGKQRASPELAERLASHFGYAISEIQILYPDRFLTDGSR